MGKASNLRLYNELNSKFSVLFASPDKLNSVTLVRKTKSGSIINIDLNKNFEYGRANLVDNYFTNLKSIDKQKFRSKDGDPELQRLLGARTSGSDVGSYISSMDQFSDEYKSLMVDFVKNIENSDGVNVGGINTFNEKISGSKNLTEDEKIQLISFSALTNSFLFFVKEDGLSKVGNSMLTEIGVEAKSDNVSNGRVTASCPIDWKEAFRDGVWGLAAGAIRGAWVGGTIGTPIGTVTGAVVFGEVGFASDVGGNLVKQIVYKCILSASRENEIYADYFNKVVNDIIPIESVPRHCMDNIVIDPNLQLNLY